MPKFNDLPERFDNYRILHISDIHLGSFIYSKKILTDVKKQINSIEPDLVFITGDLVNNFFYELKGYEALFSEIGQSVKCFSILGNHDYGNYSNWGSEADKKKNFDSINKAQESYGFRLLRNENFVLKEGKDSIYIIGVENWGHPPFPQYANLERALECVPEDAFKILLTHDPAHWDSKVKGKKKIPLTLSGPDRRGDRTGRIRRYGRQYIKGSSTLLQGRFLLSLSCFLQLLSENTGMIQLSKYIRRN